MHPHIIAAACSSGTWQQKWNCGWHQSTTGAANAGYFAGHSVAPWLIGALIGLFIIFLISRSRSRTPATSR